MNKSLKALIIGSALTGLVAAPISATMKCGAGKCGSDKGKKCEEIKDDAKKKECQEDHKKKKDSK